MWFSVLLQGATSELHDVSVVQPSRDISAGTWIANVNKSIEFRGYAEVTGTIDGLTGIKPVGTLDTDILIAEVSVFNGAPIATEPSMSAGWTLLNAVGESYSNLSTWLARGDVASIVLSSIPFQVGILRITAWANVNLTSPIRTSAIANRTSNPAGDYSTPSIDVKAGDAVYAIWFQGQTGTAMGAPPIGFTDVASTPISYRLTSSYKLNAVEGPTGLLSHNANADQSYKRRISSTIGLIPATVDLCTVVDEPTTPSDADYISTTLAGTTELALPHFIYPVGSNVVLKVRGSSPIGNNLTVSLKQSGSVIPGCIWTQILTTTDTTYEFALDAGQRAAITDPAYNPVSITLNINI